MDEKDLSSVPHRTEPPVKSVVEMLRDVAANTDETATGSAAFLKEVSRNLPGTQENSETSLKQK